MTKERELSMTAPFVPGAAHFSFLVSDVEMSASFYRSVLGAREVGPVETGVELELYGHQLVLRSGLEGNRPVTPVSVPADSPHCGFVVELERLPGIVDGVRAAGVPSWGPLHRRLGTSLEHQCLFVEDPDGAIWEIKAYCQCEAAAPMRANA